MTFDKGRALVIGIANYNEISGLPEAVLNDARDIASVLQSTDYCGFLPGNIRQLLDGQATLDAIRAELAELASSVDPDDSVVIFFSGHGARIGSGPTETSALVPVDCRATKMRDSVLGEPEFSAALAGIKARRLLVLIDACQAGGAGTLKRNEHEEVRLGFDEKSLGRLAQGAGRVIIASSRANETSLVLRDARNSVFTERLLEAFKGKARTTGDGLIRVFDVFNYVSEQVRRTVPGRQHPIFKASDLEDNFPVALDRGGAKAASVVQPDAPERWREIEELMSDLYPAGPTDQDIWARAGGDVSRLKLSGTGRANWFAALRTLRLGGGGQNIKVQTLLGTVLSDFPHHAELAALRDELG
ncbi:caspase family protein [Verrucosispora sp. WMMD573]|uniref:caspase family protein n=1 Tax=Verrucosispora sp. WMMD573 TaxID=3015149 RepID=UPI00248B2B63|nr:caspase family protein [Verrucosispora sp. WMMD573]WBB56033.1 caspase family protein [Verrucosispora sp. WMMD573]